MNHVLSTAPRWTDAGHSVGLVGVPVNAIMDWPMATRAGFAAFQDPKVNQLVSPSPTLYLTTGVTDSVRCTLTMIPS